MRAGVGGRPGGGRGKGEKGGGAGGGRREEAGGTSGGKDLRGSGQGYGLTKKRDARIGDAIRTSPHNGPPLTTFLAPLGTLQSGQQCPKAPRS